MPFLSDTQRRIAVAQWSQTCSCVKVSEGKGVEKSSVVRKAIKSSLLWGGHHYRVRAFKLSITRERMQATFCPIGLSTSKKQNCSLPLAVVPFTDLQPTMTDTDGPLYQRCMSKWLTLYQLYIIFIIYIIFIFILKYITNHISV